MPHQGWSVALARRPGSAYSAAARSQAARLRLIWLGSPLMGAMMAPTVRCAGEEMAGSLDPELAYPDGSLAQRPIA